MAYKEDLKRVREVLEEDIHEEIKQAFDEHRIEIPFPHRTLYAGAVTSPMPVEIISGGRDGRNPNGTSNKEAAA